MIKDLTSVLQNKSFAVNVYFGNRWSHSYLAKADEINGTDPLERSRKVIKGRISEGEMADNVSTIEWRFWDPELDRTIVEEPKGGR